MTASPSDRLFVVACPACGGRCAVTAGMAGAAACCPLCAAAFAVPEPAVAPPAAAPTPPTAAVVEEPQAPVAPAPAPFTPVLPAAEPVVPPSAAGVAEDPLSTFVLPDPGPAAAEPDRDLEFLEPAAKKVGLGATRIELRRLTPAEKEARRRRRNILILLTGGAILIGITLAMVRRRSR